MIRTRALAMDAMLLGGLVLLAAAVRWPYHDLVPRYTDEVREVMWALRIHDGEIHPLAAHNGYAGPLWNYLLAAAFAVVGPSIGLPRLMALVVSCLTVGATFLLARAVAGRGAGLVAGALQATSLAPVLVSGHVAWSACAAPLATTLALLAGFEAVRRDSGRLLAVAALLVAASMQLHPLGVLLFAPLLAWALDRPAGRRLLTVRRSAAAAAAAIAGYANLLAFHLASGGDTVTRALAKLDDGVPRERSAATYLGDVGALVANLADLVTGHGQRLLPGYGTDPAAVSAVVILAVLALLLVGARAGSTMPALTVATTVLLMPLFNSSYSFPLGSRYLLFLLPVIHVGLGASAVVARQAAASRGVRAGGWTGAALAAAVVAAMAVHLVALRDYYRAEASAGRTNALVHEIVALAGAEHEAGARVLLSEEIGAKFSGGGHLHRVLATLLRLDGTPYELLDSELEGAGDVLANCRPCVLLLSETHARALAEDHRLEVVPLSSSPLSEDGEGYGVWRLGRDGDREGRIGDRGRRHSSRYTVITGPGRS